MEHFAPRLIEAILTHGYIVILTIMVVEEAGIPMPIPGDGLLLFAGYLCSIGVLTLSGSLVIVVAGALIGATIFYWVSRHGGRALVRKYGKLLRLDDRRLEQLKNLFDRLGIVGPGVSRLIPGLRIYTSALAGPAAVPYPIFILNVLWSGVIWALFFLLLGYYFGEHWQDYTRFSQQATLFGLAVLVLGGAYVWLHVRRRRQDA